jgi:putative ABC transport system substrate-binding protein
MSTIGRREFIALLGGAGASLTRAGWAQSSRQIRRVGMLLALDEKDPEAKNRAKEFRLGMRDLGWVEGRNIKIDYRFAGTNLESIDRNAAELVASAPEVIVANSTPVVMALRRATSTIPIVFAVVNDPVGQGFIPSLTHPGGNMTGFSFIEPELIGKWISLLGDVKTDLSRVALMFNPDTAPYLDPYFRSFRASPQRPSVEIEVAHVRSVAEADSAIAKLAREPGSGLIAASDIFIVGARAAIMQSADKYRVPIISSYRQWVTEGCLMSYGPDTGDINRRAGSYVDRILKGEQPGNLPVQSPAKFELFVNLKTAQALGLSVRDSFLELADEVIE